MIDNIVLLGGLGHWEVIIIVLVVLLLFGGKKIPELMRGLGKGVSSFKQGLNEVQDEINNVDKKDASGLQPKDKEGNKA